MRLFVGLNLPETTRQSIREATRPLLSIDGIRWVSAENLHLTLVFLGELEPESVRAAQNAVESVSPRHPLQRLELGRVGTFPNARRPSVVWLGADGGEELLALRADLVDRIRHSGIEVERRTFRPHITLGRVKRTHRFRRRAAGHREAATIDAVRLTGVAETVDYGERVVIDSVDLIESELSSGGARYTAVLRSPLEGSAGSVVSS